MTPLNWAAGAFEIIFISGVLGAEENWLKIACLVMMGVIILFYFGVYCYFMVKDPARLQTEGYNLMTAQTALLREKRAKVSVTSPASSSGSQYVSSASFDKVSAAPQIPSNSSSNQDFPSEMKKANQ